MNDESPDWRRLIDERLAALEEEDALGRESQSVVTLDQQSVGRLSRQDALQAQAMARAAQVRRDRERTQLRAALTRLETGEFGYCEDCGEEIAARRLQANPALRLCLSCARG